MTLRIALKIGGQKIHCTMPLGNLGIPIRKPTARVFVFAFIKDI
jgi:hypothetical protein